jgi:iron complex outermembrane receptor protein
MKLFKITVYTLFFSLIAAAAGAQSSFSGIVVENKTGEPIPGATVYIEELQKGASADENGRFVFENLNHGEWSLELRSVGFERIVVEISHPAEEEPVFELTTKVVRAEDVIVTASPIGRNIQYQPAQSLNAEQLQQRAAPSLGEILDGNPGVSTRSFGSAPARPVIRGFDGDRVLVLQNGERMGDLSGTAVDHAVGLDPLAMDRVEVVRGPASLMYGSGAIGGVVNLFSADMPREWDEGSRSALASHVSSMNNMGAGLISTRYGTDKYAVTGRMIYRNGGDLSTPEGTLPDTALQNLSFGGGLGYRLGKVETGLSITGMNYDYGLPEMIDDLNDSIEIRMDRLNIQSISTMKMDRFFDHAELRVHYSDYSHDEVEISRVPEDSVEESVAITFAQQTLSSSLLLRHRKMGAMEGALGISFNHSALQLGGGDALTPNAAGIFLAGFIYEEIGLTETLSMKTGLRMEWKDTRVKTNELFSDASIFEDRTDLIFSGALGLNYSRNDLFTTGFQVARAYRTPTIEELYSFAPHAAAGSFDRGNPDLQNEISLGVDTFADYNGERTSWQISFFANRISNYVDFFPTGETHEPSGLPIFEYGSKDAILYGFEFLAGLRLNSLLTAEVGADYVRGYEYTGNRNDLTYIPPLRFYASLKAEKGSWHAGPRVRVVNRQDRVAPNEQPTDGYVLIGADAGYRFGEGVTLSLRLDNLLNERYRDHLSRVENRNAPMPGRNVNMMLRWEF